MGSARVFLMSRRGRPQNAKAGIRIRSLPALDGDTFLSRAFAMSERSQHQLRIDITPASVGRIEIEISRGLKAGNYEAWIRPKRRSNPQNDQMHVLFREIARKTGHTVGEIKEYAKVNILGTKEVTINGKPTEIARPTSDLSKLEASDFIAQLEALLHEL